jgi:hypothetical protein
MDEWKGGIIATEQQQNCLPPLLAANRLLAHSGKEGRGEGGGVSQSQGEMNSVQQQQSKIGFKKEEGKGREGKEGK